MDTILSQLDSILANSERVYEVGERLEDVSWAIDPRYTEQYSEVQYKGWRPVFIGVDAITFERFE